MNKMWTKCEVMSHELRVKITDNFYNFAVKKKEFCKIPHVFFINCYKFTSCLKKKYYRMRKFLGEVHPVGPCCQKLEQPRHLRMFRIQHLKDRSMNGRETHAKI